MKYQRVYRSHIVPRGYLRMFATNGKIAVRKVGCADGNVKSVEKAGTRPHFYRRTRPDGSEIDDVEWSLSHIETAAPAVLRTLRERWPLTAADKAVVAEFLGYQLVRGPRWLEWDRALTRSSIDEFRAALDVTDDSVDATEADLLSDTQRFRKMLEYGLWVASIMGSMHWSLLEFRASLLATSDHPVVLWPLAARGRAPEPSKPAGLLDTLEVRVPVTSELAILMTWLEAADVESARHECQRHDAGNMNAFTVANADREWFYRPGKPPPVASGALLPLAAVAHSNYSVAAVQSSQRREHVRAWLLAKRQFGADNREKLVLF